MYIDKVTFYSLHFSVPTLPGDVPVSSSVHGGSNVADVTSVEAQTTDSASNASATSKKKSKSTKHRAVVDLPSEQAGDEDQDERYGKQPKRIRDSESHKQKGISRPKTSDTVTCSLEKIMDLLSGIKAGTLTELNAENVQVLLQQDAPTVSDLQRPVESKKSAVRTLDVTSRKPIGHDIDSTCEGAESNAQVIDKGNIQQATQQVATSNVCVTTSKAKSSSEGETDMNEYRQRIIREMQEKEARRQAELLAQLSREQIQLIQKNLEAEGKSIQQLSSVELEHIIGNMLSGSSRPMNPDEINQIQSFLQAQGVPMNEITAQIVQELHAHLQSQGRSILQLREQEAQELLMIIHSKQQQNLVINQPNVQLQQVVLSQDQSVAIPQQL